MNNCIMCGSYAINHHRHGRDRSDPDLCDVCYWRKRAAKAADAGRAACANMLNLSRSDALLMAGEMTAQEWRTLSAVLVALQQRMRFNVQVQGAKLPGTQG